MRVGRAATFVRAHVVDAILGAITTAFGAVTLSYPFARDHGLFFYGAREWMLRGQVLYRDILDHKPPFIYWIYMLAIALFGQNAWGIRLLELVVAVPAMAWVAARLATPRGSAIPPGVLGAAWLGAGVADFGYLTYWDGAQCEIWYTLFATGGLAAVLHARREWVGCAVAGALSAAAFWTKPPCLPFVAITVGAIVAQALRQPDGRVRAALLRLGAFALAGIVVSAGVLGYFASTHALSQMGDLLIGVNSVQVRSGPGVHDFGDLVFETNKFFRDYEPVSGVLLAVATLSVARGFAARDGAGARRYLLAALLALAAWASVAMQRKFYLYHRATIIAAVAVAFAVLYREWELLLSARRERWVAPASFAAFVGVLFLLSADPSARWYGDVSVALRWKSGAIGREEFTRRYDVPEFYAYHDAELAGLWLRAHAPPDDTVVVRGFEPEIYEISGLHYTGRFCWSSFLTESWRAYRLAEWRDEDLAALRARPPHYAVALDRGLGDAESPAFFQRLGYVERARFGVYVVLERGSSGT
jgi:4-amino-4-deoxy-L-arabinose transferase-like glycosyltransferase